MLELREIAAFSLIFVKLYHIVDGSENLQGGCFGGITLERRGSGCALFNIPESNP